MLLQVWRFRGLGEGLLPCNNLYTLRLRVVLIWSMCGQREKTPLNKAHPGKVNKKHIPHPRLEGHINKRNGRIKRVRPSFSCVPFLTWVSPLSAALLTLQISTGSNQIGRPLLVVLVTARIRVPILENRKLIDKTRWSCWAINSFRTGDKRLAKRTGQPGVQLAFTCWNLVDRDLITQRSNFMQSKIRYFYHEVSWCNYTPTLSSGFNYNVTEPLPLRGIHCFHARRWHGVRATARWPCSLCWHWPPPECSPALTLSQPIAIIKRKLGSASFRYAFVWIKINVLDIDYDCDRMVRDRTERTAQNDNFKKGACRHLSSVASGNFVLYVLFSSISE